MRNAAEAKHSDQPHRESMGDNSKLFAKLVPFALWEERQDLGKDCS